MKPQNKPDWAFVYDEEFPDSNGTCIAGILADKANPNTGRCLFFIVCADEPGAQETCRIFNSIMFDPSTKECEFAWSENNNDKLVSFLNSCEDAYCGEDSGIGRIEFEPFEPRPYAECTVRFKDDSSTNKFLIKLSRLDEAPRPYDDRFFFYCERGLSELKDLMKEDNGEDFVILDYKLLNEI